MPQFGWNLDPIRPATLASSHRHWGLTRWLSEGAGRRLRRPISAPNVPGIDGLPNASEFPLLCRFSAAQFAAFLGGVFAGLPGVELREGLPVRMNPQHMPPGLARNDLYDALFKALADRRSPLRVSAEMSVRVSDGEVPLPDVFVWEPLRGRGPVPVERVRLWSRSRTRRREKTSAASG